MDFMAKISSSQHAPPFPSPVASGTSNLRNQSHSETSSFPIIAIAIIGILATAFLLVSYYVFVINCCLNWHRIDLLRRLSPSSRRRRPPLMVYSPGIEIRGLDESVIRSIPLLPYKKTMAKNNPERSSSECAVCLSEFEEDEMLRIIPICTHLFHIDCIDVWLQNNANCPLCRTSISSSIRFHAHQIAFPTSSPQDPNPLVAGGHEQDYVVIELGEGDNRLKRTDPSGQLTGERQDPPNSGDLPAGKLEQGKKRGKLQKVTSLGDEWIDTREKDEQFCIQPIRRSVSMDSSAERQLYLAVQEAVQQNRHANVVSPGEGCNGRVRRSLFSFGHGRSSRNAVQPLHLEES